MNETLDRLSILLAHRHEKDQIISSGLVVLVLLSILISPYYVLAFTEYSLGIVLIDYPIMISLLIAGLCVCLSIRSRDHIVRDKEFFKNLILHLRDEGFDTDSLSEYESYCNSPTRSLAIICCLVLGIAIIFPIISFNYLLPMLQFADDNEYALMLILSPFLSAIAAMILTLYPVFIMPMLHDKFQCRFYSEISLILKTKNIELIPFKKTVKIAYILHIPALLIYFILFYSMNRVEQIPFSGLVILILLVSPYILLVYLHAISSMNKHIFSEWAYEEYILDLLKNTGNLTNDSIVKSQKVVNYTKKEIKQKTKAPLIIVLSEIFLVVICMQYGLHNFCYTMEIESEGDLLISSAKMCLNNALFLITLISLLGIKSRKITSWRKTVRSSIIFCVSMLITQVYFYTDSYTHLFDFNLYISCALLYTLCLILLVSFKVKQYYTPYGAEIPSIGKWIKYIFIGKMEFEVKADNKMLNSETV